MFNAVLIDYARVMAANRQAELALKAAVRSVLSAYNTELQESYGLFGASEEETNEIFTEVLEKNIMKSKGYYQLIDPQIADLSIQFERPLANHKIYKQQILEEMKYRAPIEFTIEVVERFKPMAATMKEASKTTNLLSEVYKLNRKREKNLDKLMTNQKLAFDTVHHIELELLESEDDQSPSQEIIGELEESINEHTRQINEALKELDEAVDQNKQIKEKIREAREEDHLPQYDQVMEYSYHSASTALENSLNEDLAAIMAVRESVDQLVYSAEFFNEIREKVHDQQEAAEELREASSRFKTYEFQRLKNFYDDYVVTVAPIYENNEALIQGKKPDPQVIQKKKEREKEAQENLSNILELLEKIKRLEAQADDYQQVGVYSQKYREFNQQSAQLEEMGTEYDAPEDAATEAMSVMNQMYEGIAAALIDEESIYMNEFAFYNFKSFDPTLVKNIAKLTDIDHAESMLDIKNQEIEYILYGLETPGDNLGAAFGEIFEMRMAIHTMEAFQSCAGTDSPLPVFVCVLEEALMKTLKDMNDLLNKKPIHFANFIYGIELDYRDHLRLAMLLHGGENRISRMQALIHYQTGIDLEHTQTYVTGSTTTTVNLWFLPGVMKVLAYSGVIDGRIEGKNYKITKEAVFSY